MLKISFILLVILHAFIHLMGWIKAFGLADIPQLTQSFSRPTGLLWLIAALLFLTAITVLLLKKESWWIWATAAILISQGVIIGSWSDARFGTLPNIVILVIALWGYGQWSFNRMVQREVDRLGQTSAVSPNSTPTQLLESLPSAVKQWLTYAGMEHAESKDAQRATLLQTGRMKTSPGGPWLPVQAQQWISLSHPGFVWKAAVGKGSLMQFSGMDKLINGQGRMLIRLYSLLNVVNEQDEAIEQGAALRYLAEMVWFPQAALKPFISWESTGPLTAKGTLRYNHSEVSGTFTFNERGQALRFEALRYYQETGTMEPWVIEIEEESFTSFQGVKIPTRARVTWKLPGGDFTWYEVEVREADFYSGLHYEGDFEQKME